MSVAQTDTGIGKFTLASTGGRGGLFGREDANSLSSEQALCHHKQLYIIHSTNSTQSLIHYKLLNTTQYINIL